MSIFLLISDSLMVGGAIVCKVITWILSGTLLGYQAGWA
jgi:hypothetical protein